MNQTEFLRALKLLSALERLSSRLSICGIMGSFPIPLLILLVLGIVCILDVYNLLKDADCASDHLTIFFLKKKKKITAAASILQKATYIQYTKLIPAFCDKIPKTNEICIILIWKSN